MPLRNRKIAASFLKYNSMRVVVEAPNELLPLPGQPPPATYLFAGVPHGLFPIGMVLLGWCNFALPWRRIRAAAASVTLRLPVWRQIGLWNGGIDVSRASIIKALRAGDNVLVAMDGIAGMFTGRTAAKEEVFLLGRRKGLVRIALQTRTPMVPFVCFGNTRTVRPLSDPAGVMERLSRLLGVSLIVPTGRFGLPIPKRVPITVVIGKALPLPPRRTSHDSTASSGDYEPSEAEVDDLHAELVDALKELYYRWRVAGGYSGIELAVV